MKIFKVHCIILCHTIKNLFTIVPSTCNHILMVSFAYHIMKINYTISHVLFSLTLPCGNPEIICRCLLFTYKFYVNINNKIKITFINIFSDYGRCVNYIGRSVTDFWPNSHGRRVIWPIRRLADVSFGRSVWHSMDHIAPLRSSSYQFLQSNLEKSFDYTD